jgi:Na+/H+ antiporter NhaD/arsenite permease-like protein
MHRLLVYSLLLLPVNGAADRRAGNFTRARKPGAGVAGSKDPAVQPGAKPLPESHEGAAASDLRKPPIQEGAPAAKERAPAEAVHVRRASKSAVPKPATALPATAEPAKPGSEAAVGAAAAAPAEPAGARKENKPARRPGRVAALVAAAAVGAADEPASLVEQGSLAAHVLHGLAALFEFVVLLYTVLSTPDQPREALLRAGMVLLVVLALEALVHLVLPLPYMSVGVVIAASVLFTINPVEGAQRLPGLHMGTVPPLCVVWLAGVGLMSRDDLIRSLYGTPSLRPYHLVVMFLGSVYLCTALERSGFLHAAATKVVRRYGRSPWGLFWALGCFSACLTVLIPDDIVTMTLTPITIRMCQLYNLPEVPFLFSQFFAGNIWAVTLVTGNPTNVLLAEDMGDTFLSFAGRMGLPGVAAGLTSFLFMYLTNRSKVDVTAVGGAGALAEALSKEEEEDDESGRTPPGPGLGSAGQEHITFTGVLCLLRVLTATLFCALESVHGLPVYLVVLLMGGASLCIDFLADPSLAVDTLRHMPWELFSFVTGFLVLAEAMSVCGISRALAAVFLPLAASRSVAFTSGFVTMLFCNLFETLPVRLDHTMSPPHTRMRPHIPRPHCSPQSSPLPDCRRKRGPAGTTPTGLPQLVSSSTYYPSPPSPITGHAHRVQDDRLGAHVAAGSNRRRRRARAPVAGRATRRAVGRHLRV